MECNPADYYPFSMYTWRVMLYEVTVPLIFISLGIFARAFL